MIFKLETPWDYHKQAEILVIAESTAEAASKLRERYKDSKYDEFGDYVNNLGDLESKLIPFESDIYENEGCDC